MSDRNSPTPHPREMRAELELRAGRATTLRLAARTTPAGLLATGTLVSLILLSTAVLVRVAKARTKPA